MSDIQEDLAKAYAMSDVLLSLEQEERERVVREIKAEAEAKSKFKRGQLVRVCRSPGLSLVGGLKALPHDHDDPRQHENGRVLGWDTFGRIMIGTQIGSNPHMCDYWTREENLTPLSDSDWVQYSEFKPGDEVFFVWELYAFTGGEYWPIGTEVPAKLITPHFALGDWYVTYQRDPTGRYWIWRVLNERQMRKA